MSNAIFSGMPMAAIDLYRVQSASDEELVRMALKDGIDLSPYINRDNPSEDWF